MADAYGWRGSRDQSTAPRATGGDHTGWWAGVAFLTAIVLHGAAFLALGQIQIALGLKKPEPELRTAQVKVYEADTAPPDYKPPVEETPVQQPPKVNKLVDELDILSKLPEQEIDVKPQITKAEIAMSLQTPAASGDPDGVKINPAAGLNLTADLPAIGRTPEAPLSLAADGQMVIDPGRSIATDDSIDKFTESIVRKGAGGRIENGTLDGVVTLDDMIGLPANVLVGKKTMLPGDLLFEYNSAELRQSARVGLMKLAMLITNNPKLYCWIEGYTDLYGGEAFNLELSQKRAESVRAYLVSVLHLPPDKIVTRGYGKMQPLVKGGNVEEQSPNRRVEIKMRRTPPPPGPSITTSGNDSQQPPPPKATAVPGSQPAPPVDHAVEDQPPTRNPVLVKPKRAVEVEEVPENAPAVTPPPKAKVTPTPAPAKTQPAQNPQRVQPAPPPKAKPIEEEAPAPLKATEVEEEDAPPAKAVDLGE